MLLAADFRGRYHSKEGRCHALLVVYLGLLARSGPVILDVAVFAVGVPRDHVCFLHAAPEADREPLLVRHAHQHADSLLRLAGLRLISHRQLVRKLAYLPHKDQLTLVTVLSTLENLIVLEQALFHTLEAFV